MHYDDIVHLRATSAAWRVLRLDTAPLIIGFLGRVFVEDNVRAIPASALTERLDAYLYALADTDTLGGQPGHSVREREG